MVAAFRARAGQAERHDDAPRIWRRLRARSAATASPVESIASGYQDPHFVEAKPSFILKLQQADLLDRRRPRARDRLAAAAHSAEPQREDPGRRQRVSRRVAAARRFSRFHRDRSRARWATCTRSAIRTTGSIRRTARSSPRRSPTSSRELRPNDKAYFEQRLADFDEPPGRGREALARADGAVQGHRRS